MTENTKELESQQILEETVFNERIVTHSKLGEIRLSMPTLAVQRKIETAVRGRRKYLLAAEDTIEDATAPNGFRKVRSFKSREALMKEYMELGWWSAENEKERKELMDKQVSLITELELLGFDSDDSIFTKLQEIREDLLKHYTKDSEESSQTQLTEIIHRITTVGENMSNEDRDLLITNAASTEVDDLLDAVAIQQKLYSSYIKLLETTTKFTEIEAEYSNLFSDSWQEQLQYYQRLAQVFYCTERVVDKTPIWSSIDEMEAEPNLDLIRWVFGELNAFWQGLGDETRKRLDKYNFFSLQTEQPKTLDISQDQIISKSDGEAPENLQKDSLEATDTTNQLQNDN